MARNMHAIVIPFAAQGHITPMYQLALKLLQEEGGFTTISFIDTEYNYDRIVANGQSQNLLQVPGLRILTVPDGLPPDHGRLNDPGGLEQFLESIDGMRQPVQVLIQKMVQDAAATSSCQSEHCSPPITCIIADVVLHWMADVAQAVQLPLVTFWSAPMHANLAYCAMSDLLAKGIVPVNCQDPKSTQRAVDCIAGVTPLQACELPIFLQAVDGSPESFFFQWALARFGAGVPERARWHLVNTVYELEEEGGANTAFQNYVGGNSLPIGPLLPPAFFSGQMKEAPAMGTSLWTEEGGCMEWLDKQAEGSVLYISFGSIVHMASQQVEDVAAGVEASGRPFLWVMRADVEAGTLAKLEALKKRCADRALMVSWAPQLQVLSHRSVAVFLTHCGWNSIFESISSGCPMLAWTCGFAEQTLNARYIIHVWKIAAGVSPHLASVSGLGPPCVVSKHEVETAINSFFSPSGKHLKQRVLELQRLVRNAVMPPHGSSHANLHRFLEAMANLSSATKL